MRALRLAAVLALLASFSLPALALSLDPRLGSVPPEKHPPVPYQGGGRVGGDTIGDAAPVVALPFSDTGNTCGYADDYDAVCPYTGSTSPDVVYAYSPSADEAVMIDLCTSAYDTKVFVYQDGVGNLVACNDDAGCGYSGWQSRITDLSLTAGHTYYVVVDGYGGACGSYEILIGPDLPCVVECPPGALAEGEPPCVDDYLDRYNSGYNGFCWTPVEAQGGTGCATMCGRSCTYLWEGMSYRDTDWYTLTATGPVTATCEAEFPLQFILIWDLHCNNLQYIMTTAGECEPATLSWDFAPGAVFALWVGPSVWTGVPESDYRFEACGISGDDPPDYGACCNGQDCCLMTGLQCLGLSGQIWYGAGTTCDPDPCPEPPPTMGACCLSDGSCVYTQAIVCSAWGGTWHAGVECEPNPCPATPAERTSWGRIKSSYREQAR